MARPIIGIALGGGAARGWAHIGVLKTLIDAGLEPDIVAGTSIGAVAGACYVTGRLQALEDFAAALTPRRVFGFLDINFAGSGLLTGQRLSSRLENHLQDVTIERLERKFVAVATELGTGHEVWLIDGALVNPVPVSVCRAFGARIVVAVTLSSDSVNRGSVIHDQEVLAELSMPPEEAKLPGKNGRAAIHLLHRQIFGRSDGAPGISAVMMDAINITQDRIARSRLAGDPPDVTISPKVGGIGLFDFHRAGEAMEQGAKAAERQIDELRALVGGLVA